MRHSIHELQRPSRRTGRKRRLRERRPTVESLEERALLLTAHHLGADGHALAAEVKKAKAPTGYTQINLVSDLSSEGAKVTDSNLKNPWGMAYSTTSPVWISDEGTGVATIYTVTPLNAVTKGTSTGLTTVTIPGTSTGSSGSPTGLVFNSTSDFLIPGPSGKVSAHFIFDTLQGTIAGWSPSSTGGSSTAVTVVNNGSSATYTGLALGNSGGQNYLYAANTRSSPGIDVYDSSFTLATLAGSFVDPKLKKGFTPYNVVNINSELYVTYRGSNFRGGAVAEFNTDGTFVRQIASNGKKGNLQSPWGVALAPSSFGKFSNDLLVGNFSSGKIDAYSAKGKFLGQLTTNGRKAIVIPGLWSLGVGNGASGGSSSALYFTAGINNEADGLFGALEPVT